MEYMNTNVLTEIWTILIKLINLTGNLNENN
jgi:hypothetical protein